MATSKGDLVAMASAVQVLWAVEANGRIELPFVEDLGHAAGIEDLDTADAALEDALELLVREGILTEEDGEYYLAEDHEEWEKGEEIADRLSEQERYDQMQSYHANIWG